MVRVFTGPNSFALKTAVNQLKAEFTNRHGELALEVIDGEESSLEQIISAIESVPFLSNRKLVIANGLGNLKPAAENIEQIIDIAKKGNDLIIVENSVDKRSAYYKFLKQNTDLIEYNEPNEAQLVDWLCDEAKNLNANITRQDAIYLVNRAGSDQQLLANEMLKLAGFSKDITKENIDKLTSAKPQSKVFDLLDAAFAGDKDRALKLYEDQKAQGSAPQSIFGMLVWQVNIIAKVAAGGDMSTEEIASTTGLKTFPINKAKVIYKKIGRRGVSRLLDKLVEADKHMKTSSTDPDEVIKNLLVTIS